MSCPPTDKNCTAADKNGGCYVTDLSESVNVQNVHVSIGEQKKGNASAIDGKATLQCGIAATDAILDVQLEKKIDGNWQVVATNSGESGKKSPTIGALSAKTPAVRQVDYPCEDGVYRIAAKASAIMDGVPSKMNDWKYGNESDISC